MVDATLAPRSSRDMLTPAAVVAGDELSLNRAATLGDVLDGQAGVHASAFGGGSSRPVIRGMEGVRLRIMESGVDSGDLSADSPDHAVAIEPFFIERIEVLRGASTLLYGSSAIGGVVNVIDARIPRAMPERGIAWQAMTDYQSAAEGWTHAALATVPAGDFAIAISFLDREHNDYSIPGHPDHDDAHADEAPSGKLENSFLESRNGSAALSWFPSGRTRLTLAWTTTDSRYGVPGHVHGEPDEHGEHDEHDEEEDHPEEEGEDNGHAEDVFIDLAQSTVDLEVEHRFEDSRLKAIEGRLRYVDYDHQEWEGEEIGTDFDRESLEVRLLATYLAGDSAPGAVGLQWVMLDSQAIGEESYTPASETRDAALFLLQEWQAGNLRVEGGARAEHREIAVAGHDTYGDWAFSASLGAQLPLTEAWSMGWLVHHSERHPVATELYAFGPHAATRQFAIGDPRLGTESANGVDFSLHHTSPLLSGSLTAFLSDFQDFIFLSPAGEERAGFPVYEYARTDAEFRGFEAALTWHAWHGESAYFDIGLLMDWVEAEVKDSPDNLPRIPPLRAGASIEFGADLWKVRSSLRHHFKQEDTAPLEKPSDSYTNLAASLLLDLPFNKGTWHLVLSGENLLDEEMRPHSSPIKEVAPLPGRSVRVHLAVEF